ncbi:MAG: Ig-like domain-containing protein, partial [Candidatus Heimdallarchaeaceae archaeon]
TAVNLAGWTVEDNYDTFSISGIIPAEGYFVVAKQAAAFNTLYGFDPNLDGLTLALGNSGDLLTLYDNESTVVDSVEWEKSGWAISAVDTTIRRISLLDTDTVSDWEASGSLGDPGDGPYDEILLDDTPPTVMIISPIAGANVTGIVEIIVNATDDNVVSSYEIFVDGNLVSTASTYSWDSRTVSNGTHTILARCKDPANNIGEYNITVSVENYVIITESDLIKIMSYNIEYGIDPDWIDVVKEENPDIVIFIETGEWDDNSDELLNQHIADLNAYFFDENPYVGYTAQGITYSTSGEAIMSRFPITENIQIPIVTLDNGATYDVTHDFMQWKIEVDGTEIYLIGSHLKAMSGADNEYRREREHEGIINYMDSLGEVPILYMGDLNSFSPDDTGVLAPEGDLGYGPLTMMLHPEDVTYGQYASENHIFTDVFRILNPTDPGYTYGHQNPTFDSRIDFIIANDYLSDYLVNSTVGDTSTADTGSDHYAVDFFLDIVALQSQTDITAPARVLGVDAIATSNTEVSLTWTANSENDIDHYNIYRDGTYITQTIDPSYSDSGLNGDTVYTYEIAAVDTSGNEGIKSDSVIVRTQDEPTVSDFPLSGGGLIICLAGLISIRFKYIKKKKRV